MNRPATDTVIVLSVVALGGFLASIAGLAAGLAHAPCVAPGRSSPYTSAEWTPILVLAAAGFPFGCAIGTFCTPVASWALAEKPFRRSVGWLVATVSPVVVASALVAHASHDLGLLILLPALSGFAAFHVCCLLIRRFVPDFDPALCRYCGYNLTGLPEPRCPECGREFDIANTENG